MRIIRSSALLFSLAAISTACSLVTRAQGYDSRIRSRVIGHAFQTLSHATIFSLGGVGWTLTMTPEEEAFHVLRNSPNSIVLFKRLLNEGNPEGQMYALYGLYLEDQEVFKSEAEKLKLDDGPPGRWEELIYVEKGKIRIGIGCVLTRQVRKIIIVKMEHADFDQAFKALSPTLTH